MNILNKAISYTFYLLIFAVPLILYPNTSEIFEFNKIVFTYLSTLVITFLWICKMVIKKEFIFKRTLLDIPIIIFLIAMLTSTLLSINIHTSIFGYYSRFHGGLLSYLVYSLLYWSFVSNLGKSEAKYSIYAFLTSAFLVSVYGILQHFGIDKDIWVQDVQTRVFSTLGQPNWMAAWLAAIIPISWAFSLASNWIIADKDGKINWFGAWTWILLSFVFLIAFSYTKSRSGFMGLFSAGLTFWSGIFILEFVQTKSRISSQIIKRVVIILAVLGFAFLITGTPWSPSLGKLLVKEDSQVQTVQQPRTPQAPLLEVGGSRSVEIRQIVWTGALDIWKDNPILGTGPETFAYSYYNYRPADHNLVSEWDFLYNKAHNEYLNFLSTTGIAGTLTYILLSLAILLLLFQNLKKSKNKKDRLINLALLAGIISMFPTNFFGFSVVPVGLQMFLFPAISVALQKKNIQDEADDLDIDNTQKTILVIFVLIFGWFLLQLYGYWKADIRYTTAKAYNDLGRYQTSNKLLEEAIEINPSEPDYWLELGDSTAGMAILLAESGNDRALQIAELAYTQTQQAVSLNPFDVNILRKQGNVLLKLSLVDLVYLERAEQTIERAVELAPTEAKLLYNLGVIELRQGKIEDGKNHVLQAIEFKPDYSDARFALALALSEEGQIEEAKEQLNYILENINPEDSRAKEELENLENQ